MPRAIAIIRNPLNGCGKPRRRMTGHVGWPTLRRVERGARRRIEFQVESRILSAPKKFSGVYRSGQTGQTVNLMALPSLVRIQPRPLKSLTRLVHGDTESAGRGVGPGYSSSTIQKAPSSIFNGRPCSTPGERL